MRYLEVLLVTYIEYMYVAYILCHIHRMYSVSHTQNVCMWHTFYGVATIRRLLKIIGLFCKRALSNRRYSVKETYNLKEPTSRSHPFVLRVDPQRLICYYMSLLQKSPTNYRSLLQKSPIKETRVSHNIYGVASAGTPYVTYIECMWHSTCHIRRMYVCDIHSMSHT